MTARKVNNSRGVEGPGKKGPRLAREKAAKEQAKRNYRLPQRKKRIARTKTGRKIPAKKRRTRGTSRARKYRAFRVPFLRDFRDRYGVCAYCGEVPKSWFCHHGIPRSIAPEFTCREENCVGGCKTCGNMTDEVYKLNKPEMTLEKTVRGETITVPGDREGWRILMEKVLEIFPDKLEWFRANCGPYVQRKDAA